MVIFDWVNISFSKWAHFKFFRMVGTPTGAVAVGSVPTAYNNVIMAKI